MAMNILLVTGTMAQRRVEASSRQSGNHTDVTVLPIPVAALMTPSYIAKNLTSKEVKKYDCVLVSGMIKGDMTKVSEKLGVPVLKGPRNHMEIPEVTRALPSLRLSTLRPADEVLQESLRKSSENILEKVYQKARKIGPERGLRIGRDLFIGRDLPPKLAASLHISSTSSFEQTLEEARRLIQDGAKILILSHDKPAEISNIIEGIRDVSRVALGLNVRTLKDSGRVSHLDLDLLTDVSLESLKRMDGLDSTRPIAVRPNGRSKNLEEDLGLVEEAVAGAREIGFESVLAMPGLDPPFDGSLIDSLLIYRDISDRHPEIPLYTNIGEIVEHIDADSVGLNCLLSALCVDLGVGIMEVSENSNKAVGSVKEVSTSLEMMIVANEMKKSPERIGIDLFRIKERRRRSEIYRGGMEMRFPVSRPKERGRFDEDPKGLFIINIDEKNKEIVVMHQNYDLKITEIVKGSEPLDIFNYLMEKGLVSRLDHAAYLGAELEKARVALDTKRTYVQELPLFGNS